MIRNAAIDLLAIFDAITKALNTLQTDTATIAQAVEAWMQLLEDIKNLNNPDILDMPRPVVKRY